MSDEKTEEKTYVIGTHDAEIERLGVQHRVWRANVLDLWRSAGLTEGMTVIDAGAGPGHATLDLAEIVGPHGKVIAIERSRRFLDALERQASVRGLANIQTMEADLVDLDWSGLCADRLWCRWVLAFVADVPRTVRGMASSLRPGGALMIHEYYDYAAWRLAPQSMTFEDYVAKIIVRWRASGGEPDIALALPGLLADAGLTMEPVRPQVFAARMSDFASRWPMGFAREYLASMIESGFVTAQEGAAVAAELARAEIDPNAVVITPGVLQIVARKPI